MLVSSVETTTNGVIAPENRKELSTEDFLRLLMMELQNQDPLEPMDNAEMLNQMAQMSNLEATESMTSNMAEIVSNQRLMEARQLLGKEVTFLAEDGVTIVTGIVEAVEMEDDSPRLVVDGQLVDPSSVIRTSEAA